MWWEIVAKGAIWLGIGVVGTASGITAVRIVKLGGQALYNLLQKHRARREFLGTVVPRLPRRFGVQQSFLAFMCAVRHLQLARFPKDIRQLLWRHFLKDAPSAPAPVKGERVVCVEATMACSGVPVHVVLERHADDAYMFVLFKTDANEYATVVDRLLTSKKNGKNGKKGGYYTGHWIGTRMLLSKTRYSGADPKLELVFDRNAAANLQKAVAATRKALCK